MKKKCRKCGKEFVAILTYANYCSVECEKLASNPVAKFAARLHKAATHPDKTKYNRKRKHREQLY